MDVKYPGCEVQLTGGDGNAFAILGTVKRELAVYLRDEKGLDAKAVKDETDRFMAEATSGDYDNLLRVCMEWVEVS